MQLITEGGDLPQGVLSQGSRTGDRRERLCRFIDRVVQDVSIDIAAFYLDDVVHVDLLRAGYMSCYSSYFSFCALFVKGSITNSLVEETMIYWIM